MSEQMKTQQKGNGFEIWWEERSLPQKILAGIGFSILGISLFALLGLVVMALWNWLMPEIFGLKQLNYLQAWGLLILSTILFKGIHLRDNSRSMDRKRRQKLRSYINDNQCVDAETLPD